jgi:hypothetical protein
MALIELDDRELSRLRQIEVDHKDAANWRQSWGQVLADPKTKMQAWRAFREKFPNVPIPELDTVDAASAPILAQLEELKKQIAEDKEAAAKEKAEREESEKKTRVSESMAVAHRRLRSEGWDDEGIKAVEELMVQRNIGDYDVAAAFLRSQMPKPAPLNNAYEGRDLNWFNPGEDEPDTKLLMENPKKFKSDMVRKFFTDKASGSNMQSWAA